MHLKEIIIFGFKSFADKTVIEFDKGITVIVGPNGSGKSNIFDAIRWVLGEQSAKSLRGAKMEDVIFAGSDTRKTLGMAEVSLVLDNEDKKINLPYTEIKITRRLYRSGESEYLINDNPCRLRDIIEMFMDTGIGIDSYSIISQGEVDRIINAKPEERREIFEEAAGITKHRKRKEETLRKLEATEQDMVRINDILEEVKRQVSSLEKQAKKAEKYKILKEETQDIEIKLLVKKIKDLNVNYENIVLEKKEIEEKVEKENLKLKEFEENLEKFNREIIEKEKKVNEEKNSLILKEEEVKRLEDNLNYNAKREDELRQRKEDVEKEIQEIIEKSENLKLEITKNQSAIQEKQNVLLEKEKELENYNEVLNKIEKEIEELLLKKQDKINELELLEKKLNEIKSKITEQDLTLKGFDENIERLELGKKENEEKIKLIEIELQNKEQMVKLKEKEINDIKILEEVLLKKKIEMNKYFENINETIKEQNLILGKINSKYNFLKDMQEKMVGYSNIVKKVLTEFKKQLNIKEKENIIESIGNLINVEKKYAKAIEKIFNSYLQAILVKNFNLIDEIFSMYENEKGEIIFLNQEILDKKYEEITNIWRNKITHKFIEGYLPDLLETEEKFKTLKMIFYNVYVVSNLEKAKVILDEIKINDQFYLLTLDDEIISNYGYVRKVGSELELGTNLLTRIHQLNEIKNEILLAEERLNSLNGEKQIIYENLIKLEHQIENLSNDYHAKYIEIIKDGEKIKQRLEEKNIYLTNLEKNKADIENLKKVRNDFIKIREDLKLQQIETETNYGNLKNEIEVLEKEIKNKEENKNNQKVKLDCIEKEIIKEKGNIELLYSNCESLKFRKTELENRFENLKKEVEIILNKLNEIDQNKKEIMFNIKRNREELLEKENDLKKLLDEFSIIKNKRDELEKFIREMGQTREKLKENLTEIKIKENEMIYEMKSLYNKLKEEFKIEITEDYLKNFQIEEEQYKELSIKLEENKKKIENIGVINLVAIEEFETAKRRQDFLQKQYDDLVMGRENLKKIIKKINEESSILFSTAFEKIRNNFKEVFKMMMKGGDADVILIDKENILESGIDIIAKPPGKKLQNISLLSGGEKAVTAISLLFAIFLIKTSPFCIMDEVDAPLDDVNIIRFTKFLKEFKDKTQFIIITHNKLTMEMADIIYGVSMEKDGVSKIISVRLDKIEEFIK